MVEVGGGWIHKGKKTSFGGCTSFGWPAPTLVGDSVARLISNALHFSIKLALKIKKKIDEMKDFCVCLYLFHACHSFAHQTSMMFLNS